MITGSLIKSVHLAYLAKMNNMDGKGGEDIWMTSILWVNFIAFLVVAAYAISLFVYLIKTRMAYIKLGKKVDFDHNVKKRLHKIWVNVFGQKKLLKDKKSGMIHVLFFYGFILVQFG